MDKQVDRTQASDPWEARLVSRRRAIGMVGGTIGALALFGCSGSDDSSDGEALASGATTATAAPTTGTVSPSASEAVACVLIPEETEGPYPLDLSGSEQYVRQDITEGRAGVPLTLTLRLLNVNDDCSPIAGARVDVWHCDKDGVYSGYSQPGADTAGETFCRGIQLSDETGTATFTTIYPGWYQGRITHIHFQVFLDSGLAATSQLAFPEEITHAVYENELYAEHGQNTSVTSFAEDNVFSDGTQYELCTITEDADTGGYDATLTVGVAA